MRLRASSSPVGPGRGIAAPPALAGWTPAGLAGLIFGYQVPLVGAVTNGDAVSTISSTYGGSLGAPLTQATGSKQPLVTTASPLDGHAGLVLTVAGVSSLVSATGGILGAAPHTLAWIGSTTYGASFYTVLRFGPSGASNNSILGTNGANRYWAGRGGNGAPVSTYGDAANHLFVKTYDGATVRLYVDGELHISVADASYTVAAGLGIGDGFSGTSDAILRAAIFASGVASAAPTGDVQRLAAWARRSYPTIAKAPLLIGLGDSQTAGFTATVAPANWPLRIKALGLIPAAWEVAYAGTDATKPWGATAVGGWTTTDVLGAYVASAVNRYSGQRTRNVANLWIGTNDIYGAAGTRTRDAAATFTNITTIVTALKAAGFFVVNSTPLPRTQANTPTTYAADQAALRASILANSCGADAVIDAGDPAGPFNNSDSLTYFQADKVHLNPAGEDLYSAMVATAIGA